MIKQLSKPNPLNFFDMREAIVPPSYFSYIIIPSKYNLETAVRKWIYYNLRSRFYVGKTISINESDKISQMLKIGFEDDKELSFFMLACPLLKYN